MKHSTQGIIVRCGKILHYIVTVLSFTFCCHFFESPSQMAHPYTLNLGSICCIYAFVLLFSLRAYSAYQVGLTQTRTLVFSQTLANLVTLGVAYILFLINWHKALGLLPFVELLGLQFLWNCLYSWIATKVYFHIKRPMETVVIYRDNDDLHRIAEMFSHEQNYKIIQLIRDPSENIHELLKTVKPCEAIFVVGIPATLRNGIAKYCMEQDIRCYVAPHTGDVIMMGGRYMELFCVPMLQLCRANPNIEYVVIKRIMDIVFSLLGIVVFSPFMLLTALAVKLYDGGPVLYKQIRLTKDGKEFEILKFRSMRVNAEKDGVARLASQNDSRITPVGKFIRACRFDELPQLFNILRGDMSIVGPRPERPEIARQYEQVLPAFSLRLQVKAGLTGFAQVYGKYNTDPYDKLRMDLMYINKMSLLQDLKLMLSTVKILFMKESTSGVSAGQVTAAAEKKEDAKEDVFH